jgi:nucleoside-diphosphate-sugar epimerase
LNPRILVTGGSGFIGAALVNQLVREGAKVSVLDNNSRGALRRLARIEDEIEFVTGDVRDPSDVDRAVEGVDEVYHLAFVNGTEFFYSDPDLVLDVGVRGIINVVESCRRHGVGTLVLASSSEVYQTAPHIPTDETAPLVVPDPRNPRYSYGAGKIISEVIVLNNGRKFFDRVLIFRPHNIYGPDMGFEHVIPQFAIRMKKAVMQHPVGTIPFSIQGTGTETRSFCHVSDLVRGVLIMQAHGEHLGIYHIGTAEEVAIAEIARRIAAVVGREIEIVPSTVLTGSVPRRCPDISKLTSLGYQPAVPLSEGIADTVRWYWENSHLENEVGIKRRSA